MILKFIVKKQDIGGIYSCGSIEGLDVGPCEHGNNRLVLLTLWRRKESQWYSVRTSKRTCASTRKTSRSSHCRQMAVYCTIYTEHLNCGAKAGFSVLHMAVRIVNTRFWRVRTFGVILRRRVIANIGCFTDVLSSSALSLYICHDVGPLVDPFRSHVSRSLFKSLP